MSETELTESIDEALSVLPDASESEAAPAEQLVEAQGDQEERPEEQQSQGESEDQPEEPEEDFSDEREWTPERIKSARSKLEDLRRKATNQWAESERRAKRIQKKESTFEETKRQVLADKQQLVATQQMVQAQVQALRSGNNAQRLDALGQLLGMPGHQAMEELSLAMAGEKSMPQNRPDKALVDRLERMEQLLNERNRQSEQQSIEQAIAQKKSELARAAKDSSHAYAKAFAENDLSQAGELLGQIKESYYREHSEVLDDEQAVAELDAQLKAHYDLLQRAQPQNGKQVAAASGADAGRETRAGEIAKTEQTAQRPPGQSMSSLSGESGGSTREMTDEERLEAFARELDLTG